MSKQNERPRPQQPQRPQEPQEPRQPTYEERQQHKTGDIASKDENPAQPHEVSYSNPPPEENDSSNEESESD